MTPPEKTTARHAFVVDLDDTLIKTDLLFEQTLRLAKRDPSKVMQMPFWLLRGKAYLKQRLAESVELDPAALPYRENVLAMIQTHRANGSFVLLASASPEKYVARVREHLGCFDDHVASNAVNLKGEAKQAALHSRLGETPFTYVGDSSSDLPIWKRANAAVAVNPSGSTSRALERLQVQTTVLRDRKPVLPLIVKQMRVHQWVKNLLVFVPLLAAHAFQDLQRVIHTALAFLAFSFVASAVYALNDLLDLESDRKHATKKRRPLASGDLPIPIGIWIAPVCLLIAMGIATRLPGAFSLFLAGYFVCNIAYSMYLKRMMLMDVIVLASLYTWRLLAGAAASDVPASRWLLAFSTFIFFGLALVKRYTELLRTQTQQVHGRGYAAEDRQAVLSLGTTSSLIAVLVLVLYFHSPEVARLYSQPTRMWLVTPIFLYWVSRVWVLAHRGQLNDDPVVFALRDRPSWAAAAGIAAVLWFSL